MRGIRTDKLAIVVIIAIVLIVVSVLIVSKNTKKIADTTTNTNSARKSVGTDVQIDKDPVNIVSPESVVAELAVTDNGPQLHDTDSVYDVVIVSPKNGARLTSDRCDVAGKVKNTKDGDYVRLFVRDDYGKVWPQSYAIIINGEFQSVVHIGESNGILNGGQFAIFAKLADDRTSQLVKVRRIR